MFLERRTIPGLSIHTWLIGDADAGECAIIDPSRDVDELIEIADARGVHIAHIIETHVHADFVSGARELTHRLPHEATIHASTMGGSTWTPSYADEQVEDGDEIRFGDVKLRAVHTPGHTPEHLSWALYDTSRSSDLPQALFTGDFLFVGDVGRPDLLDQDDELARQLYHSVFDRLPRFGDHVEVLPGHGPGSACGESIGSRATSTLGYERRCNQAMVQTSEDRWVRDLLDRMSPPPSYFGRMKRLNVAGPSIVGPSLPGCQRLAPRVVDGLRDEATLLDVRSSEAFAAGHVRGAVSIPRGDALASWAGQMLTAGRPLVLVLDDSSSLREVVGALVRVGLDDVVGYLDGGMEAWTTAGLPIDIIDTCSVYDLQRHLRHDTDRLVLDVRSHAEWTSGHIAGARHVHIGELPDRIDEIATDRPLSVICGSGYRASVAASLLQRRGAADVANVLGGMTAWSAAGLPVEREVTSS